MFRGIKASSCATAWAAACNSIIETDNEGYNVVIDIQNPAVHNAADNAAINLVDKFLKSYEQSPVITVANTIFPQSLYDAHKSPAFYGIYHRDFDKFSKESRQWGQYFDRMTRWKLANGETINPLKDLISKLKGNEQNQKRVKAVYEMAISGPSLQTSNHVDFEDEPEDDLTIYSPSDRNRPISGPCLSYLSFKRHIDGELLLTVVYRNHYYITKLLGNLIGLGQLQAFVAKEAGLRVGSLTVVSTHATIDIKGGWKASVAKRLVSDAARLLSL